MVKLIIMLLLVSFGLAQNAMACSCVQQSPAEYFDSVDAVFLGKVLQVDNDHVKFEVEKAWKLISANEVEIISERNSGCPFIFEKSDIGQSFLIYAWRKDGIFYTGECTGTERFMITSAQIADLRKRPEISLQKKSSVNDGSTNILRIALITGLFLLLSISVGFILSRFYKRAA